MATHSSILAWRIPCTEEPGGYRPWGRKELDTTERLGTHACSRSPRAVACTLASLEAPGVFAPSSCPHIPRWAGGLWAAVLPSLSLQLRCSRRGSKRKCHQLSFLAGSPPSAE